MAIDGSSSGRHHLMMPGRDLAVPLAVGAGLVVLGAAVGRAADWGAGAYWMLGIVATCAAFAVFARRDLARLRARRQDAPAAAGEGQDPTQTGAQALGLGLDTGKRPQSGDSLSPRRVVVLSGHSRSGKSKMADALSHAHPEWALVSCGSYVRAEAGRRKLPLQRDVTDRLGQSLVDELGGDRFLEVVLQHASVPSDADTLIIDDVYHLPVFEAIERRWDHLSFVKVNLPTSVREALEAKPPGHDADIEGESELDRAAEELERVHQPTRVVNGAPEDDPAEVARGAGQISDFILQAA